MELLEVRQEGISCSFWMTFAETAVMALLLSLGDLLVD